MKQTKNILIIINGYSSTGVGEQFLGSMLSGYTNNNIYRYSIIPSPPNKTKELYKYNPYFYEFKSSVLPVVSSLKYWRFKTKHIKPCINQIVEIIEQNSIDIVWVFLNSYCTIQIAANLKSRLSIPMVSHIWDSPEYLTKSIKLGKSANQDLLKNFDHAMKASSKSITVSDYMSSLYSKKYNHPSEPMVFCPPKSTWHSFRQKTKQNEICIVFAGSLYAYKPWNAFLDSIESNQYKLRGKKITVTCIGNVSRWAKKRKWVNYLALKPMEEAAKIVNEADIAYLPYWMDKAHAHFVKTAFPGKMSFYIASGTPVFFHGPEDSTPTRFLKQYAVGKSCNSLNENQILKTIEDLLSKKFQQDFKANQEHTLKEVFHPDRSVEIFNKTIQSLT